MLCFFFKETGDHRDLHSCPPRRSSDLSAVAQEAPRRLEIDDLGLDETDRRILTAIIDKFDGGPVGLGTIAAAISEEDRKSTRLNSSHANISYAVFCLKKKIKHTRSFTP